MRNLRVALGLCVLLGALAPGARTAAAEDVEPAPVPPLYTGAMSFPAIQGPEGHEDYSWTVDLDPEQELVQVDGRTAAVNYVDGPRAFTITAVAAHDAEGTDVPTTLAVSEGSVITLTVHHRAGNPGAGGAPFDYPVVAGVGWEGGFHTHHFTLPPGQKPEEPAGRCVVPRLAGNPLARARARLAKRDCRLGAVRGKRGKRVRVVKQFRAPGSVLAAGAKVTIKLG